MSWLFFLDESSHGHEQMRGGARTGVALRVVQL